MKFLNRYFVIAFVMVAVACQSPKEKAMKHIRSLEGNDSAFSTELMTELKTAYVEFSKNYPDDEAAPEFLFKGAQRAVMLEQPKEAVDLLQLLIDKYPKSPYHEDGLFLLAYTCENNLNDLPRAKTLYEKFLKEFPNGELAKDANISLENLGKSPEEILKSLPAEEE